MPIKSLGPLIVAIAALGTSPAFADITINKTEPALSITIRGTITSKDADALVREESSLAFRGHIAVQLNSSGGDVAAAIRIGRTLRKYDAWTTIAGRDQCLSSCALIYIAGVRRRGYGVLGLHRPYLSSSSMSREAVQQATVRMQTAVQSYVAEMGISPTFYDIMARTDPSQMKVLKGDEVDDLIPANDSVWDEIETSYDARSYGISTVEVRRRKAELDTKCIFTGNNAESVVDCREAISWGLSEGTYRRRKAKLALCRISTGEREILAKLPTRQRKDHEITVKAENCQRQAMLSD